MITRYKAVNIDGYWYVGQGRTEYFPATQAETQAEAKRQALLWMMRDAYQKCEELYAEGVDEGLFEPYSMGDYLC